MKRCSSNVLCTAGAALLLALASGTAYAALPHQNTAALAHGVAPSPDIDAVPVINTSRMVTYTWSPDRSFAIRALGGMDTFIKVPQGETIEGFYLSNAADWHFMVTGDHKRVLLKPSQQGLYNTALMVTNKRSYQLTLVSVPPTEVWFQAVTWVIPGRNVGATGAYWTASGSATSDPAGGAQADPASLDPADLYFNYQMHGDAAFRPEAVFDNGKLTWMRMDPKSQDMPAIFAITDGKLDVVNYTVKGDYVVIPRVANKFVLRLNNAEVTVQRGCNPTKCLK